MGLERLRMVVWWIIIQKAVLLSLTAAFWYRPDRFRAAYVGAGNVGEQITTPLHGHAGLLATMLADGWMVLLITATITTGFICAAIAGSMRVWHMYARMLLLPITAKVVIAILVIMGWNRWLITAGRYLMDQIPNRIWSTGSLFPLELLMQLLVMMIVITALQIALRTAFITWRRMRQVRHVKQDSLAGQPV